MKCIKLIEVETPVETPVVMRRDAVRMRNGRMWFELIKDYLLMASRGEYPFVVTGRAADRPATPALPVTKTAD